MPRLRSHGADAGVRHDATAVIWRTLARGIAPTTYRRVWLLLAALILGACGSSWEVGTPEIVEIAPLPTLYRPPTRTYTPPPPTATPPATAIPRTPTPTRTPVDSTQVVIAVQMIPDGAPIPPAAVALVDWPLLALPGGTIDALDDVIGQVAVSEIGCGEPILRSLIGYREIGSGYDPLPDCPAELGTNTPGLVDVVIATRYLEPGEVILPNAVALRPWPAAYLPPGAYTTLAAVIGTRSAVPIRREQPVLDTKLMGG